MKEGGPGLTGSFTTPIVEGNSRLRIFCNGEKSLTMQYFKGFTEGVT